MLRSSFISLLLSVFVATWVTSSHAMGLPKIDGVHPNDIESFNFIRSKNIETTEELSDAISNCGNRVELRKFRMLLSTYRRMGNWEIAEKLFHLIYWSNNASCFDSSMAAIGLSRSMQGRKEKNLAMDWAKKAIDADKTNPYAYFQHAVMCRLFSLRNERVVSLQKILELSSMPEIRAWAHIELGNARVRDRDRRIFHYKVALALGIELGNLKIQADAHLGLGNARDGDYLAQMGQYKSALQIGEEIGDTNIQVRALIGRANVYGAMRNNEEELQILQQARDLDPRNSKVKKLIRRTRRFLGISFPNGRRYGRTNYAWEGRNHDMGGRRRGADRHERSRIHREIGPY